MVQVAHIKKTNNYQMLVSTIRPPFILFLCCSFFSFSCFLSVFFFLKKKANTVEMPSLEIELHRYPDDISTSTQRTKAQQNEYSIHSQSITISDSGSLRKKNSANEKKINYKSWLLWWNSEEWWSCWIGLIFFGCITSAVKHNIPSPHFLSWEKNPFSTFAAPENYGLIVISVMMGTLLWLSMAFTNVNNWKRFPIGYTAIFFVALISKVLANNGNKKIDSHTPFFNANNIICSNTSQS